MKGPKLAIVGSCVGCEDLRPLHTKRGAVIPAGCAQKNGKEVGGYTPAWCPELHAATVAHARAALAPTFTKALAKAIHESDNGMGSGDLHDLLASIGGEPHDPEAS